jgi:hypothetical protein
MLFKSIQTAIRLSRQIHSFGLNGFIIKYCISKSTLMFKLMLSLLMIVLTGCPEDVKEQVRTELEILDVSCTEAVLRVRLSVNAVPRDIALFRNDSLITTLTGKDSIFVDSTLSPNSRYEYSIRYADQQSSGSVMTLDTTSHDIQWQPIDTLGAMGYIHDVWIFSQTDAWAVGEIMVKDSTGNIDWGKPYNAAHWDGVRWNLLRIPTISISGITINAPLYSIYGFSPSSISVFSNIGSYSYWDGLEWNTHYVHNRRGAGRELWGTSSSNVYLVGDKGSISHFDGKTWTLLESGTTVDLQDIYGITDEIIWSAGISLNDANSVVVKKESNSWKVYYEKNSSVEKTTYNTVWMKNKNRVFLSGSNQVQVLNTLNGVQKEMSIPGHEYGTIRIRGTDINDIFKASDGGEIAHFNGVTWRAYPEYKIFTQNSSLYRSVFASKDFVLFCGIWFQQINGIPIVIRGYR